MLVRRRPRTLLVVPMLIAVSACGPTAAAPSATSTAAPAATIANQPTAAASPSNAAATSSAAASASPLEGQIVFDDSGPDFSGAQLWLENADGSNARQVLKDDSFDTSASLSPDGTRIVFGRILTDTTEAAVANPSLFGAVTLINVDGSGLQEIHTGDRAKLCDEAPEGDAWSPDGSRIAYVRYCFDKKAQFVEGGIWTMKADGTDARQVTKLPAGTNLEDHRAAWSPDGTSIVFERIDTSVTRERAAIFTIGTDGTDLHQVTEWSVDGNDPDWSPDGTEIAFSASAEPSPTQNIWTIHPDGSGLTQLTTNDQLKQATFHPTWSPDGAHILFSHSPSEPDGSGDLFVMDADGANQHVLAMTAIHENHGQWGPSPAP